VSVESYVTNLLLPVTENLHGQQRHLSAQYAEWNIMILASSGIFADEFPDKRLREWTKQALITLAEATEAYLVEVTAEFPC
jgi:hypothetical protein